MPLPNVLERLVGRFAADRDYFRSSQYNEALCRVDFVNPMFEALGWDVANAAGRSAVYRDVIHEDAIEIEGATKAPDYSFGIGRDIKYFVEAKRPEVNLFTNTEAAFQLRRYGWTAKLALSVLTDFEEFSIYDCRVRPAKTDRASRARVFYCTYDTYSEKWDEISSLLSRAAVVGGSLNAFASQRKAPRGTVTVDADFLDAIEGWREALARNLALRNTGLTQLELNYAVQRLIDRLIFLRIAEDRGIEPYGRLQRVAQGHDIYSSLVKAFRLADERYNSGLFHFDKRDQLVEPVDDLTPRLQLDDAVFKQIIGGLYYPDSPYEFAVLPADILGQVYEQFLGKVIQLTPSHSVKVEAKPEVRKAGGVYYTPTHVVEYIIAHTIDELLAECTPREAAKIRVLDPACGSGSFLICAYQHLLDWHLEWYFQHEPEKHAAGRRASIHQTANGSWRLTTAKRKEILLNSIFGVDIDPQAVEVTKLSLLLKVLEGERSATISAQMRLFNERALPDLGRNIKCGNSLIGPDFFDARQLLLLDADACRRANAFEWAEEFRSVGGAQFSAVVGNPPYVLLQDEFRDDDQLAYFRNKFRAAAFKLDTYHLFIEKGMSLLARGGRVSMITPANFLTNNHLEGLRRLMLDELALEHVMVIEGGVFKGVSVDNAIFVAAQGRSEAPFELVRADNHERGLFAKAQLQLAPDLVRQAPGVLFTGSADTALREMWKRVEEGSRELQSFADVNFGKQLRDRKRFRNDVISVDSIDSIPNSHVPCYTGRDVLRYSLRWGGLACLNSEIARRGGCWDERKHRAKNKLVTRQIGRFPEYALDPDGFDCLNTMFMVNLKVPEIDVRVLLGVLNSRLLRAYWVERFYDQRATFPKIKGTYLERLPIKGVLGGARDQVARRTRLGALVEERVKTVSAGAFGTAQEARDRHASSLDRQIDQLVLDLYGLDEADANRCDGILAGVRGSGVEFET